MVFGYNFIVLSNVQHFLFVIECVLGGTVAKARFKITCIFAVVLILIPLVTVDMEMY